MATSEQRWPRQKDNSVLCGEGGLLTLQDIFALSTVGASKNVDEHFFALMEVEKPFKSSPSAS